MKNKKIRVLTLSLIVALIILLAYIFFNFLVIEEEIILYPKYGKDTDGTQSETIIENIKEGYETVILKFYPYGFLEVWGFDKINFIKRVYAIAEWRTEKDLGAGNIYIGFSLDGKNYEELGPFDESENFTKTILEIHPKYYSNIDKLRIRFRGEDLDYAIDAYAEVKIYLKVIRYKFRLY